MSDYTSFSSDYKSCLVADRYEVYFGSAVFRTTDIVLSGVYMNLSNFQSMKIILTFMWI